LYAFPSIQLEKKDICIDKVSAVLIFLLTFNYDCLVKILNFNDYTETPQFIFAINSVIKRRERIHLSRPGGKRA